MKHPVQISYVGVKELTLKAFEAPDPSKELILEGKMIPQFNTTCSEYNEQDHSILVFSECSIGSSKPEDNTPLFLHVVLGVMFKVIAPEKFNPTDVLNFGKNYSKFMIHPFLREHVYSLSLRAGFQPIILRSLQVPIFSRVDMV